MDLTDLKVARVIPAKPKAVFEVWIDPASPGSIWFGAERAIVNPQVDGLFYWAVRHEAACGRTTAGSRRSMPRRERPPAWWR
jgi:hypothetical protein